KPSRPAPRTRQAASGIQEVQGSRRAFGRTSPASADALAALAVRAADAARSRGTAVAQGRVVGPGQRLRPIDARDHSADAEPYLDRRHADAGTHGPHRRVAGRAWAGSL